MVPDRDADAPLAIRLTLRGAPTVGRLKVLRAQLPDFANIPVAELRRHLEGWPAFVAGYVRPSEFEEIREVLAAASIAAELIREGLEYELGLMPFVDRVSFETADETVELLVRPSFTPEYVVRCWRKHSRAWLELSSLHTQVAAHHYWEPPWLVGMDEEVPSEDPFSEMVEIPLDEQWFESPWSLPPSMDARFQSVIVDGWTLAVRARRGQEKLEREFSCPGPGRGPAFELFELACQLAASVVSDPRSLARLADSEAERLS